MEVKEGSFGNALEHVRSVRRFSNKVIFTEDMMRRLINSARLSSCSGNLQRLRFSGVAGRGACEKIFPLLRWAGYLKEWDGPEEGERPSAYIVIWHRAAQNANPNYNAPINLGIDIGIAAQNIILTGEIDLGASACMIASFDKEGLKKACGVADYEPMLVIALGSAAEKVVIEEMGRESDVKYWRDAQGVHHVPKRSVDELMLPTPGLDA